MRRANEVQDLQRENTHYQRAINSLTKRYESLEEKLTDYKALYEIEKAITHYRE
jgi:prefoldin subunit 5